LELAVYPKKQTRQESLPLYPHGLAFAYVDLIGLTCHEDKTGCPTEAQGVPFISDSHHLNATFIAKLMRDLQATQSAKLEDLGLQKYLVKRSGP
jgi:hypothetical protein